MRVTAPLASARIGDIEVRGVQLVVELEALELDNRSHPVQQQKSTHTAHTTQAVPPSAINAIQSRTAIVVPCKNEPLGHIRGVWAAIPAASLIVLVSGSEPDNYAIERDALAQFCQTTGRSGMSIHQQDPRVADALRAAGMKELLDDEGAGLVHRGKGEGLVIGIALAATAKAPKTATRATNEGGGPDDLVADLASGLQCDSGCRHLNRHGNGTGTGNGNGNVHCSCSHAAADCDTLHNYNARRTNDGHASGSGTPACYYKYIGFVDADNFVPGSVQEYCRAFSAGLHLADAEDAMVRINWSSKPKVDNGKLHFKPSGRSSEIVNLWLNQLLKSMNACIQNGDDADGKEATDLICTGNAGEHAMTMSLALKLRIASGYAIEPFHFLDILERFAGDSVNSVDKESEHMAMLPELSRMAATCLEDEMPVSPVSMSPVGSPCGTPLNCSPTLSACEECTQPTSPSVTSTSLGTVPAVKLLPPPLNTLPSCQAALDQTADTTTDFTPPESPTFLASPAKVQIIQIRTINPHFHDNKGNDHVVRMWKQGLSAIYHSPVVAGLTQYREELRTAVFGGGGEHEAHGHSTPPFSTSASVAMSPSLSVEESVEQAAVMAAAGWQPAKCRIYPTTGSMNLQELRGRLEKAEGGFWWSGKEAYEDTMGLKRDLDVDLELAHASTTPQLGFDTVAVLGLGPVSRERRPQGDVDGFKECVDKACS